MGQDARVRYTKRVIKEQFVGLLKSRPLNRITVKKICELAEINRATFYKYYADPFDLLDKMEQELMEELRDCVTPPYQSSVRKTFVAMLEKMRTDGELYRTLFSENGDNRFPFRIISLYYQQIDVQLGAQFPMLSGAQREWLYYFMAQGCSGILNRWVENGMREPVEEVAVFAERLIENTVRGL